jgi:hypothetical protein
MLASKLLQFAVVTPTGLTLPFGIDGDLVVPEGDILQRAQIVPAVLQTAEVDLTTAGAYLFSSTTIPGKVFIPIVSANFIKLRVSAVAGSLSVAPLGTIGNNSPTFDNLSGNTPVAIGTATVFGLGAGAWETTGASLVRQTPADLSAPMQLLVTTPATGTGLTFTGRFYMAGYLIDV